MEVEINLWNNMDASAPYFAVQKTQKALTKLSLKSWEYKGRIGLFLVEQVIQGTIYPLGHLPVFNPPNEALPLLFKVKVVRGQFLFSSNCVVNSINHDFRLEQQKNACNTLYLESTFYPFILSGQKLLKMPKIVKLASFWKTKACSQSVLPDRSIFNRTKIAGKCQNSNETF